VQNAQVTVTVTSGRAERSIGDDTRRYDFTISIENRSSVEKTFDRLALRVSFRTRANFCGAVDVAPMSEHSDAGLHLPLRVGPDETISGALHFETSNVIPRHCRIDAHAILIGNADGERYSADASLPDVVKNDHDGTGPSTWGWD
jgi:hypothetical protein